MEKIRFLSYGEQVEGTLVTPNKMSGKNPGVIFFHGMTSNETRYIPIAERLADHGIIGLTLSIRGHGASEGDFDKLTVNDAVQDGLRAYDFFANYNFIDQSRIGLCGASVGAAIASMVSAQRDVKSLALRVPATYSDEMMKMTYKELMSKEGDIFYKISNISDTPAVRAISEFNGSLLVIISEKDIIIPVTIPNEYLLQANTTTRKNQIIIPGADHALSDKRLRERFIDETVRWFVETL